tara:strand:- start:123 stop:3371 length:3249 start_codon:yes stop_codon:yes gene_type:complete
MATTPPSQAPSFEQQLSFLNWEMGTSNGGNVASEYQNNPSMTVSQAATAFENKFERSGGSALTTRINNAEDVFTASRNGTLTSISPNVSNAYNYFAGLGYSPQQASGIVGNLMAESGRSLDPAAFNSAGGGKGAFGIAQWRADRQSNLLGWDGTAIIPREVFTPGNLTTLPPLADPSTLVNDAQTAREMSRAVINDASSNYEDNILNQFDSYTYNWAVHMVHPAKSDEFEKNIEDKTYITLAESGVENEISIENVIQQTQLAFVQENRNAVANSFDITFLEPLGFTFYNRLILASKELGIENHLDACYLLELNFRGWNSDGTSIKDKTIGPFYYMTVITDFKTKHQDSATTYQVTFIESRYEAYNRLDYHLKSDIPVIASNFGDFLTKFEEELNKEVSKQTATSQAKIYPTKYKFGTTGGADEWKTWEFDAVIGESLEQSRNISMTAAGGAINFTIHTGTSMTAAIAAALLQTKNFKKIPLVGKNQFAKDQPDQGQAKAPSLAELMKWFSFQTEVKYLNFDPRSRQYQKEITYNVQDYIIPEGIHDPRSYAELNEDPELQQSRLDNIYRNGLLKKRFDYTYTGLNTEVLDLDLSFDMMYFVVQPINGGATTGQGAYFDGLSTDAQAAESAKDLFSIATQRLSTLNTELADAKTLQQERWGFRGAVENPFTAQVERITTNIQETKNLIERARTAAEEATAALQDRETNVGATAKQYITQTDLFANSTRFNDAIAKAVNFDYRSVDDSLAASGADTKDDVGTALLGALELNLNSTGDMVTQLISVRGDPYWLGKPKGSSAVNSQLADYDVGGVGYFLNVRFPVYEGHDGFMNQELTNFSITAIYRVINVGSTYMGGEFKQTLESFRDTNTNVPQMIEQLVSGKINNQEPKNLKQTYTENGTPNEAPTASFNDEIEDNSSRIDETATGADTGSVTGATNGVDNRLLSALSTAATQTGVTANIISGDRGPGGSGRHEGYAADTQLYSNGKLLSVDNPQDLKIIQNYTQNYINATRAAGLTPSIGVGNPAYGSGSDLYMSGTAFHYDIARSDSILANLSPNAGPYWGGSGGTASHKPPTWLVNMYNS